MVASASFEKKKMKIEKIQKFHLKSLVWVLPDQREICRRREKGGRKMNKIRQR